MVCGHRILVVDDERDLVTMVERYLKAWNFAVDAFTDPVEALAFFRRNPSFFSLVFTDLRMPGMSGIELSREILKIKPDMKVMLMTAYDLPSLKTGGGQPIFKYEDVLRKPFRLAEICEGVKKQLQISY